MSSEAVEFFREFHRQRLQPLWGAYFGRGDGNKGLKKLVSKPEMPLLAAALCPRDHSWPCPSR